MGSDRPPRGRTADNRADRWLELGTVVNPGGRAN